MDDSCVGGDIPDMFAPFGKHVMLSMRDMVPVFCIGFIYGVFQSLFWG